jgi:NTE family protein
MKVFQREGIPIDCLTGTSMGGIIAAGYASGLSPEELEEEAKSLSKVRRLLRLADPGLPDAGLLRGQRLREYFEKRLGDRDFADLRCSLALVAVDLNAKREVILREGPVALAVHATIAVPGLFTPVEVDGQRLVDGGLLNNLPIDVARKMDADIVIAIDVEPDPEDPSDSPFVEYRWMPNGLAKTFIVLDEATRLMMRVLQEVKMQQYPPDLLIRPRIPAGVNMLVGYSRTSELIEAGVHAAEAALPKIRELMRADQSQPTPPLRLSQDLQTGASGP